MDETVAWLLEGDPSIRWQARRDLLGESESDVDTERSLIATTGWGKRFLDLQDGDGLWASGLYSPKWKSTTYTLLTLERLGLPDAFPAAAHGTNLLLEHVSDDGRFVYWPSHPEGEACVTAMVCKLALRFVPDSDLIDPIVDHLGTRRMPDGGWNCRDYRGDTHSSVHTTISVLEALQLAGERGRHRVQPNLESGAEFLLAHRLFKSHRTGEVIHPSLTRFSFPPRWFYDVLRGLEHMARARLPRDPRAEDAMELVYRRRRKDGTWLLQNKHSGKVWFDMEPIGAPSRMNTLRALRVVDWWEHAST